MASRTRLASAVRVGRAARSKNASGSHGGGNAKAAPAPSRDARFARLISTRSRNRAWKSGPDVSDVSVSKSSRRRAAASARSAAASASSHRASARRSVSEDAFGSSVSVSTSFGRFVSSSRFFFVSATREKASSYSPCPSRRYVSIACASAHARSKGAAAKSATHARTNAPTAESASTGLAHPPSSPRASPRISAACADLGSTSRNRRSRSSTSRRLPTASTSTSARFTGGASRKSAWHSAIRLAKNAAAAGESEISGASVPSPGDRATRAEEIAASRSGGGGKASAGGAPRACESRSSFAWNARMLGSRRPSLAVASSISTNDRRRQSLSLRLRTHEGGGSRTRGSDASASKGRDVPRYLASAHSAILCGVGDAIATARARTRVARRRVVPSEDSCFVFLNASPTPSTSIRRLVFSSSSVRCVGGGSAGAQRGSARHDRVGGSTVGRAARGIRGGCRDVRRRRYRGRMGRLSELQRDRRGARLSRRGKRR